MRSILALILAGLVAACAAPTETRPTITPETAGDLTVPGRPELSRMARTFVEVVETVEPVAERECRRLSVAGRSCDFRILVDDRPDQPPNAFQTVDRFGRPIIAFTLALIADAENGDELAFVLSHEAAHHIAGHLERQREAATIGAVVFGQLAGMGGGDFESIEMAQQLGAEVGARSFSKDFELEADALGTIIAARAGYDPVRGSQFFNRIPDPGDRFLGTHPPNAERLEIVRRTAEGFSR